MILIFALGLLLGIILDRLCLELDCSDSKLPREWTDEEIDDFYEELSRHGI